MHTQIPQASQHRISNKLNTARDRLRQLSRDLSSPFRKQRTIDLTTKTSPVTSTPDLSTESSAAGDTSFALYSSTPSEDSMNQIMDGTAERALRRSQTSQNRPHISAIFLHAGAGYHSTTNEHIHLGACNDAAKMAMQILKAGGTAVDAVEIAIKVLEDKEITNAGFGSNLSIEGIVECDATVVDHLGRSGACGATAQIRNPIHLARIILDASNKPLSLRRVPPNLLVGQGATDFAYEHGIPVVPHEYIVSKNARDRFVRWREDLIRAERGRMTPGTSSDASSQAGEDEMRDREYEERVRNQQRRDHVNAIIHGTWNEGQPDSPQQSPGLEKLNTESSRSPMLRTSMSPSKDLSVPAHIHTRTSSPDDSPSKRPRYSKNHSDGHCRQRSLLGPNTGRATATVEPSKDVRPGNNDGPTSPCTERFVPEGRPHRSFFTEGSTDAPSESSQTNQDKDMITDTVGAIAIDMYGNMAAGSSSGGIGMKHRGRVGPAALVGIGTAVIPVDDRDRDGVSVAAVTSGTGEHMATTMASQKCAERLYHSTRRAQGGADISATEEEAMESFVMADFMGHSGVRESNSAGAIGVMAVKKTNYGWFLYFAHNTDSFALASMHSNEKDPKCVMSRLGEHGTVVQGARKVRVD